MPPTTRRSRPADLARQRALDAVGRYRAMGLHFLGHYLGIEGLPDGDDRAVRLTLPRRPGDEGEPVTDVEIGVLVDLAMGQAVRSELVEGVRLATSSLVINLAPGRAARPVVATAAVRWLKDGDGSAAIRFDVTDKDGGPVATGSGSFSVLSPVGRDGRDGQPVRNVSIVDWARASDVTDADPESLAPQERAAVDAATAGAAAGGPVALAGLLDLAWGEVTDGALEATLDVGPQHENRVGDLQGGLVYGIGAAAARRLFDDRRRIVDGQVLYLRPAGHGTLGVSATVLRAGRRLAFVRVVLHAGGRQTAELTFTLGADGSG